MSPLLKILLVLKRAQKYLKPFLEQGHQPKGVEMELTLMPCKLVKERNK
jgi:hypothetical protein